jgi:polysaccharide export outer membrane protein
MFDEEDIFFEQKPSNQSQLKNTNQEQQAKLQSETKHKTKVQPKKPRRIEKPQSEKPKRVEKLQSKRQLKKPQKRKQRRIEKPQLEKQRTVKPPPRRKQQPKPQIDEKELNPTDILSSYRLGAGDKVSIKVFGEPDFSVTTHLSETGTISYPFLGELKLAGLTISQVEKRMISGLQGDYLINPKVTITILEYRKVFINGEVRQPGGYSFVPGLTVEKSISLAGGFTEMASRDDISIVRNGNPTATPVLVKLKTYIRPGDIIFIKEYPKFFVDGEVRKPGAYIFKPGMTVKKAISLAGGFTEIASRDKILVVHKEDEMAEPLPIDINDFVQPGDIITVDAYKKFFVKGEVKKPGAYPYEPGLTVEKAISIAGGFTEFASSWSKILVVHDGNEKAIAVKLNTDIQPGDIITVKESLF